MGIRTRWCRCCRIPSATVTPGPPPARSKARWKPARMRVPLRRATPRRRSAPRAAPVWAVATAWARAGFLNPPNPLNTKMIMKTNKLWGQPGGVLVFLCCAALTIHAQQRPAGGGGGFAPFGGGFFNAFNNGNRNASTTGNQYNNNGNVGNATIYVDPDTKNIIVISDQPTSEQISNVIAQLDRPKPQVLIKVVFLEVSHNNSLDLGVEGAYGKGLGNGITGNAADVFGLSGLNSIVTNFSTPGSTVIGNPALSPTTAGGANGFYQIMGSDFQASLRAIATAGKVEVLSRPSVLARDG